MITTEEQYKITKQEIGSFKDAIRKLVDEPDTRIHPVLRQAELDGLASMLETLQEEVRDYVSNEEIEQMKERG